MKKLAAALVAILAMSAPAAAGPLNVLICGTFVIPATCTPAERIVGGAIVGAGLGMGAGALVGTTGGAISGGVLAAKGTAAMAWSGAAIGAAAGVTAANVTLVAGGR